MGRSRSRNRILCSLALKSDIRWHQIYSDSAFASDSALLTIVRVYKLYYLLTYLQKAKMAHLGLGPYRFQSNNLRRCWMYRPAANINTASSKFQAMYHERKYLKNICRSKAIREYFDIHSPEKSEKCRYIVYESFVRTHSKLSVLT